MKNKKLVKKIAKALGADKVIKLKKKYNNGLLEWEELRHMLPLFPHGPMLKWSKRKWLKFIRTVKEITGK